MFNDRAETLAYRVKGAPKCRDYENSVFRIRIHDDVATFYLKGECPSLEAAEKLVDEFLLSFEADQIFQGEEPVTFTFEHGRMKSGGSKYIGPLFRIAITGALAEENSRQQFPWRKIGVASTPTAALLLTSYEEYKAGRDRLSTVAYLVLSTMQAKAGGRKKAANDYKVALDVLDRVGNLSSDHGDLTSARKFDELSSHRQLTATERFWLEAATRTLILRIHEIEANLPVEFLDFDGLPRLDGAV